MPKAERAFNVLLGLSVLSWAPLGLAASESGGLTAVRGAITALHLSVGTLLIFRAPAVKNGSLWAVAASLPALVISGWALQAAPPLSSWPAWAEGLFVVGTALAIVSMGCLGRNFAILPAVRGITVGGPFRIIRHPVYAGELLMILACGLARPSWYSVAPVLAILPLAALRILIEERLLKSRPEYEAYSRSVRWRLIPRLW